METASRIALTLALVTSVLGACGCRERRGGTPEPAPVPDSLELFTQRTDADADVDWDEEIPVFHLWRDIPSGDFYFDVPSPERVGEWMALCEGRNPLDSASRRYVQGYYGDMNQYVTANDFTELWYHDDSRLADDDLTTWRLMQYAPDSFFQPDSEYDKFFVIRNVIQGLLLYEPQSQWELNVHASLEEDFQEFYDRLLVREAVRHADGRLAAALEREQETWLGYHAALDSAFRVIDGSPGGAVGSAWTMAICGILCDDARLRAVSLEDFYFALADGLDYKVRHRRSVIGEYDIERHERVSDGEVLDEYRRFMEFFGDGSFFDQESGYPVSVLRGALAEEVKAWRAWMAARRTVSSLLSGLCKETYDNATNNVRRRKLIMLKNRYQGYGIISGDILDCILPYDCTDPEIGGFSFEEKWCSL